MMYGDLRVSVNILDIESDKIKEELEDAVAYEIESYATRQYTNTLDIDEYITLDVYIHTFSEDSVERMNILGALNRVADKFGIKRFTKSDVEIEFEEG